MVKDYGDYVRVNKEFHYNPNLITSNIAECFGLGGGYTKKICNIDIPKDFSVMYITGESGSGKTSILNEIVRDYTYETIPYDKPLSHWLGDTQQDEQKAISLLSLCGLSDATMFISEYRYLSDSEKARARMFLELSRKENLIVIDEFLSTLDRKTAKSLAYCFQKAVRKLGKRLIAVTAHDDLVDYLKPDVVISGKSYPSDFTVKRLEYSDENPFINNVVLRYVGKDEYRELKLGELHYKGKYTGGTKEFLFAYYDQEVIGCLVSIYNMSSGGRRISRLVVHPSYRSIGIGSLMVERYISDFPNTDVIAAMALYNKVFEKAKMIRVKDSVVNSPSGLKSKLEKVGFDSSNWHDKEYCLAFSADANVREIVSEYADKCTALVRPGGKKIFVEQIAEIIKNDTQTCGRVLYQLRDRTMAKYVTKWVKDNTK